MERTPLSFAAINGFLAVAMGAFGAHGLKNSLKGLALDESAKILGWVDTGSRYQLAHAAALVGLAALAPRLAPATVLLVSRAWGLGALLFSATLYAMALGGPAWLGAITPLGGLGLLLGWGALGLSFGPPSQDAQ